MTVTRKTKKIQKNNNFPTRVTWEMLGKQWEGGTVLGDAAQMQESGQNGLKVKIQKIVGLNGTIAISSSQKQSQNSTECSTAGSRKQNQAE
jgi:hypothetical protein